MEKTLKKCQMEILRTQDFERYKKEIAKPWENMEEDILMLNKIVTSSEDVPCDALFKKGLSVSFLPQEEGVDIRLPQWLFAAMEVFEQKYGQAFGCVFLEKALAQIWENFVPAQPLEVKATTK